MRSSKLSLYAVVASSLFTACSAANTTPIGLQHDALRNALVQYSAPKYEAVPLPAGFNPVAMMKDGQIPGSTSGGAAIYRDGKLTMLGEYEGYPTFATSVNSNGVAVGYADLKNNTTVSLAVEYKSGAFSALREPTNCQDSDEALSISDTGEVYGTCWEDSESNAPQIARYKPGTPSLISGPLYGRGYSVVVNASGEFAFTAAVYSGDEDKAASGTALTSTALFPRYRYSYANWINDHGTIVGSLTTTQTKAFVYPTGGPAKILPLLSNATSMSPTGVNDSGTVLGNWSNATSGGIFLYKSGVLSDITNSITPAASYRYIYPGLSDSGAFVAASTTNQNYLVKPVAP